MKIKTNLSLSILVILFIILLIVNCKKTNDETLRIKFKNERQRSQFDEFKMNNTNLVSNLVILSIKYT